MIRTFRFLIHVRICFFFPKSIILFRYLLSSSSLSLFFFVDFIFACFSLTHETSYINILWGQNFIHTLIIILLFLKSSVITTFMHLPLNKQDYSSRTLSLSSILQQVATTPKRREKKFKLKNKKKKISIKIKLPLSRADNKEVNWNVSNCVWKIFK